MKILLLLFSFLCFVISGSHQKKDPSVIPSQSKIINQDWTFNYFPSETADDGYESPSFDDSGWPVVSIPHTWNTYETTGELPEEGINRYWKNGWGWYRKHFTISPDISTKKVFLEFRGVQDYCRVWINGNYLGEHKGGYGMFDFDITPHLKGSGNLIAVAVYNGRDQGIDGTYDHFGGIFRDVVIVIKNRLYIPMQGSSAHEGGTCISTPGFSGKTATVKIQTWVKNEFAQVKNCQLQTTISDASGKTVQVLKSNAEIKPGQIYRFDQTGKPFKNPKLWSPASPYLYQVRSEIIEGGQPADVLVTPLGFRWIRKDKNGAVILNGAKIDTEECMPLNECKWLGNAVPAEIAAAGYNLLSGKPGCSSLRLQYPEAGLVYDLTDKNGIIVRQNIPVTGSEQDDEKHVTEIIRRYRNHPSVFLWNIPGQSGKFQNIVFAEDTTRILSTVDAKDFYNQGINKVDGMAGKGSVSVTGGVPCRVVLSTRQTGLKAGRGSVAIIRADVVDASGNKIRGAKNILYWTVSGPARLIGPDIYEPGEYGSENYPGTAFTNVIRSDGRPGKINVRVFAAGLVSGTIEIESEAVTDDNGIVDEIPLSDEGRSNVERLVIQPERYGSVPADIKFSSEDIKLNPDGLPGLKRNIRDYLKVKNPGVDTSATEAQALIDVLTGHLSGNNGLISAEDYNFNVKNYNLCRLISGYIAATKLPARFKEGLRDHYSSSVIVQGSIRNADDEMNWLNWIPSGGTVVIYTDGEKISVPKDVIATDKNELSEIISLVHPKFPAFSAEAKERAIGFITKMNPYVCQAGAGENQAGFYAEKGKPVLIPLYKFISE